MKKVNKKGAYKVELFIFMKWDFKIKHDCKPLPFAKGSNI